MDGADLDLFVGGELVEGLGLGPGVGEIESVGDAAAEQVQMFIEDQRRLGHVEAVDAGGIQFDQLAREEIGLLLVVAFDADAVPAADDGVEQREGVFPGDEFPIGERGGGLQAGKITVSEAVKFHGNPLIGWTSYRKTRGNPMRK